MTMRFRPANIRLINRRSNLPRLLLALSSINGKSNDKNNTTNVQGLTGHSISGLFAQADQNREKPAIVVPPAPPISGSDVERQSCPLLVDNAIPVNTTIEAKPGMVLDSHRQKTGKKLWANSVYEMDLHECRMPVGAPVFGSVYCRCVFKGSSPFGVISRG